MKFPTRPRVDYYQVCFENRNKIHEFELIFLYRYSKPIMDTIYIQILY